MKHIVTALILMISILLFLSCASRNTALNAPTVTSTPDSSPLVIRNDNGDYVKQTGWDIPKFPEPRTYSSSVEKQTGREIKLISSFFTLQSPTLITLPSFGEDGETTWKVSGYQELKGESQPPFCYGITVTWNYANVNQATGGSSIIYIKDEDGDGIFETLSDRCLIPAWVK